MNAYAPTLRVQFLRLQARADIFRHNLTLLAIYRLIDQPVLSTP
jgi:hypothetical protein